VCRFLFTREARAIGPETIAAGALDDLVADFDEGRRLQEFDAASYACVCSWAWYELRTSGPDST
jgi:hypothetical protein